MSTRTTSSVKGISCSQSVDDPFGMRAAWERNRLRLLKHKKKRNDRDRALGWPVPKELRQRVETAFACCEYCGVVPSDGITIDRIVPGAKGGRYEPTNITGACFRCNTQKCAKDFIGPVRTLVDMEARGA